MQEMARAAQDFQKLAEICLPSIRIFTKKKIRGFTMRHTTIALLLAALSGAASAAPTWQTISSEPGKRIELDRTSIKRDEPNKVQAQGRVILEKEILDARSGAGYRVIEAITRYDCVERSANTIKRIYKKNENEVVREEEVKGPALPVRSGTLDDKVLREVCRPTKESAKDIAQKANEAGAQLKQANEALIQKELAKPEKATAMKTAEGGHETPAGTIPSIRPNLKTAVEAAKPPPAPEQAPAPMPVSAPAPMPVAHKEAPSPKAASVVVHTGSAHVTRSARSAKNEGYMLEVTHKEAAVEHAHMHWSYEGLGGPENWAKLDPANQTCATGQRQSPIDIRDGIKVDLEPIKFNYRPSSFRIVDNGHTIQVNVADSSLTVTGKTYDLVQFHFHKPSEEKVDGHRFDMVAHLVHKADDGQLAVVAVLMERGTENPFIQSLWNNLPLEKNVTVSPPSVSIDPAAMLPTSRNYYTYMGSLTTPPCTEGVLWLVMKQPVQVSNEQIAIFSRFYSNNARPIQSQSGRVIKEGR
jgi:carbonic anhydrase